MILVTISVLLMRKVSNQISGFTLIELMVVIAIIGVLSSVIVASTSTTRIIARDSQKIQNVKAIQQALELYAADHDGNFTTICNVQNVDWTFENAFYWNPANTYWNGSPSCLSMVLKPYIDLTKLYEPGLSSSNYHIQIGSDFGFTNEVGWDNCIIFNNGYWSFYNIQS